MENLFSNFSSIFCIRSSSLTPFITSATVVNTSFINLHKLLLQYCYDKNFANVLVFENEITLLDSLTDSQIAELTEFIDTNKEWDVLIIGKNDLSTIPVNNLSYISHLKSTTTWVTASVYVASNKFMKKVKTNHRSMINTYVFNPAFVKNTSFLNQNNNYTVGQISNMVPAAKENITYCWNAIQIIEATE